MVRGARLRAGGVVGSRGVGSPARPYGAGGYEVEAAIRSTAYERAKAASGAVEALVDYYWSRGNIEEYERARDTMLALREVMEGLRFRF